jgi:phosphonate transport system substrate-binding protein
MTVSPDFSPDHIAGWYIFNTWLQRQTGLAIHLRLFDSFEQQRQAIENNEIDIIYANPFDASMLVREKGFMTVAKPQNKPDEAIIAVADESTTQAVEDLQDGTCIAQTDDPDVNMMGMIMLEPGDLNAENTSSQQVDTYILVAKKLLTGQADVGFFLKDAYDNLSSLVQKQLRILVSSQIHVITHVMLVSPKLQDDIDTIRETLLEMPDREKGQGVLDSMGMTGWDQQTQEDTEFMIDLMDTLSV